MDVVGNVSEATVEFTIVDEAVDIHKLIADLDMACSSGWITGKAYCKVLKATLIVAREAIERNRPYVARWALNAFLIELRVLQKEKKVNQQAYDLLTAEAKYVIGTLR